MADDLLIRGGRLKGGCSQDCLPHDCSDDSDGDGYGDGMILMEISSVGRQRFHVNRYDRRLPHWGVVGQPLFVTFRLDGSLPANRVFPPAQLASSGEAFVTMDRLLDKGNYGPLFLRRPEIGDLLVDAIRAGERRFQRYELHAFVVMANHVHMLVTPQVASTQWLGPLKGFTANQANRILAREGTFWQDESYDRLVRSSEEFERIRGYIERNPVKAGLVEMAEEFRWSSANKEEAA